MLPGITGKGHAVLGRTFQIFLYFVERQGFEIAGNSHIYLLDILTILFSSLPRNCGNVTAQGSCVYFFQHHTSPKNSIL
jgi:hypothetical protein